MQQKFPPHFYRLNRKYVRSRDHPEMESISHHPLLCLFTLNQFRSPTIFACFVIMDHLQFFLLYLRLNMEKCLEERNIRSRRVFRILNLLIQSAGASLNLAFPQRRMWAKIRSSVWWEETVLKSWTDEDWKEQFRINRSTFFVLCEKLKPLLQNDRYVRKPISAERCLAVTLSRLGSSGELRNLAELFGMGRSTVCVAVQKTCAAIIAVFSEKIKFPQGEDLHEVMDSFLGNHGMPGVCGALDGTHIPIKAPGKNSKDYYNHKKFYSMILQGIVDHKKKFINVNFGWPGSVHDARVLVNSDIFDLCENGFLDHYTFILPGTNINMSPYFVADPAYPLKKWIMKPYSGTITPRQAKYNKKLSSCRIYVEHAFGMLKGRWRCLLKVNDSSLKNIEKQVIACCILHNICQDVQDAYLYSWDEYEGLTYSDETIITSNANVLTDNKQIRETLVQWCNDL